MADTKAKKEESSKEEKTKKLSKNIQTLVDAVKKLSLMEVAELVKALEKEFGVSAAAPVMAAATATAGNAAPAEEQSEFDVILKDAGSNKIGAIKAVRVLKPDLGLSDAKKFVESTPQTVLESAGKDAANEAKKALEEAGCVVELK
ncbi:50S ribosomal protein L7/L12 [Patescibacteria group bacterium]|nr:50S ribosomal protein L7/L12 [Patescibacteria group bacterium]MBU1967269.1 50S ribosomal protein L7/L12 [Patescibacteria group bacterium]MBU2543545.1 50S ribosomal protein L7/L12 [Patescibacteria group bacterium]